MSAMTGKFNIGDKVRYSGHLNPDDLLTSMRIRMIEAQKEGVVLEVNKHDYTVLWGNVDDGGFRYVHYEVELAPAGPVDFSKHDEGGVV